MVRLALAAVATTMAAVAGTVQCLEDGTPPAFYDPVETTANQTTMTLTKLNAATGALCLDGTPGAFYFRAGTGSGKAKWYIHHQGGGWCESLDDCLSRSKGGLGSSASYAATSNQQGGYFSQDPSVNPMMYNWNMVFMPYCDGGSFSGNNATATEYNGATLHFRGKTIREENLKTLMDTKYGGGLGAATDVVISGCSAGGLATYLHADSWCDALPHAKCVALPDSGFFLDYQNPKVAPTPGFDYRALNTVPGDYHRGLQWVYEIQNATAGINEDCVAAHQSGEGDAWTCMFAEHTSAFTHTPVFALQSEYDSWQVGHVLNTGLGDDVNVLGANITSRMYANLFNNHPASGAFLDSCYHHCGMWNSIAIDGDLVSAAFAKWYSGIGKEGSKTVWKQGKPYPCTECCKV